MKVLEAKVVENRKEAPESEPDQRTDTWLIEGKLAQDVLGWENLRVDVQTSEIGAEIIETSMASAREFTVRTRGQSRLKKGDALHVAVREASGQANS
jgi:hypothetical protein